jgi:tripartite-type tricarboxylate transporter receptor subunit TctC
LISHLKNKTQNGFYGTGSNTGQVAAELFKVRAGLETTYVPFKATVTALAAVLSGEVDFITYDATWAVTQREPAGRLRILAATSAKRSDALPGVPTLAELGIPWQGAYAFWGILAPAGTPKPIIDKLVAELNKVIAQPDVHKTLTETLGMDVLALSPEASGRFLADAIARWGKVVKDNGITNQ